ncbi:MAG: arginase family protein [Bilifractor sp.]
MKTIRLLYPDYVSGGLETYYFGAELLQYILPQNLAQPLIRVDIVPPDGKEKVVTDGIYGRDEVAHGIDSAYEQITKEQPDKIITIGGNCLVSFAPFDYLHGKYDNTGILWIDAHPDVSVKENGYPCAHAMVLGSLLGAGDPVMTDRMQNSFFHAQDLMYVGLQGIFDYQKKFLDKAGVNYRIQTKEFVPENEIISFLNNHDHILVHFDIDALDEHLFHSTYYANPAAEGDGSGGGRMTVEQVGQVISLAEKYSNVVGLTIAEYLPFDEEHLHKMLSGLKIFQ